jgi:predicted DNA-binding protein
MKKLISIQLDDSLLKRLKTYCSSIGATMSGLIRVAIISYLESNNA